MTPTIAPPGAARLAPADVPDGTGHPGVRWSIALLCVGGAGWMVRELPGWTAMWTLAGAEFVALKFVTLHGVSGATPRWRIAAYVLLWPGMNAAAFLHGRRAAADPAPAASEVIAALAKTALGVA